jgi:hypothetical protein
MKTNQYLYHLPKYHIQLPPIAPDILGKGFLLPHTYAAAVADVPFRICTQDLALLVPHLCCGVHLNILALLRGTIPALTLGSSACVRIEAVRVLQFHKGFSQSINHGTPGIKLVSRGRDSV